ncbi:hypothetical protein FGB62_245g00 [Gracilaria domingensis]|nr:hypothetical protein FGB62_245g00 [Gracilaria domingensis]
MVPKAARSILTQYLGGNGENAVNEELSKNSVLEKLTKICESLNYALEEEREGEVEKAISEFVSVIIATDGLTVFEISKSGIMDALASFFSTDDINVASVRTVHTNETSHGTSFSSVTSGLRQLTQPFKVRLNRAAPASRGESLRDYSNHNVLIEPLAIMASVHEFLCPRVREVGRSSTDRVPGGHRSRRSRSARSSSRDRSSRAEADVEGNDSAADDEHLDGEVSPCLPQRRGEASWSQVVLTMKRTFPHWPPMRKDAFVAADHSDYQLVGTDMVKFILSAVVSSSSTDSDALANFTAVLNQIAANSAPNAIQSADLRVIYNTETLYLLVNIRINGAQRTPDTAALQQLLDLLDFYELPPELIMASYSEGHSRTTGGAVGAVEHGGGDGNGDAVATADAGECSCAGGVDGGGAACARGGRGRGRGHGAAGCERNVRRARCVRARYGVPGGRDGGGGGGGGGGVVWSGRGGTRVSIDGTDWYHADCMQTVALV